MFISSQEKRDLVAAVKTIDSMAQATRAAVDRMEKDRQEFSSTLQRIATIAEDAKDLAHSVRTAHSGHETLCTERWTASKATMDEVKTLVWRGINSFIGFLVLLLLGAAGWFINHLITLNYH